MMYRVWSMLAIVSISDEKPLHMRLQMSIGSAWNILLFQSQMRSRSTCDIKQFSSLNLLTGRVSISDEKPFHMRHQVFAGAIASWTVSISDERVGSNS